ncbi:MAG: hypothetical protein HY897_08530 [Deltaproteobacteria bacterium]|nr:hypothetical protein [Deltaproteobacteria bacterium]
MKNIFAATLAATIMLWGACAAAGHERFRARLAPALSLDEGRLGAYPLVVVRYGVVPWAADYPVGDSTAPWPAEARAEAQGAGWLSAGKIMLTQGGISFLAGAAGLGLGLAVGSNRDGGPGRGAGIVLAGAGAGAVGYAIYAGIFGLIWLGVGKLVEYRPDGTHLEATPDASEYPYAPGRPASEISTSGYTIAGWIIMVPGVVLTALGATVGFNSSRCAAEGCTEAQDIVAFAAGFGVTAVGTFTGLWGLTFVRIGNDRDAREYERIFGTPPPDAGGPRLPDARGLALKWSF